MTKTNSNYHEVLYHVDGYSKYGFVTEMFDNLDDALEFWGRDDEWLNAELVAEHFYSDRREHEVIRNVEIVPIHELFRH